MTVADYVIKVGDKFSRWTAISKDSSKYNYWICRCECGTEKSVFIGSLRCGRSKSCGCLPRNGGDGFAIRHGDYRSAEYRVWSSMLTRCSNPKSKAYEFYGARGIIVCPRWQGESGFSNFLADMGRRPSSVHSLDRIETNGNYEKGNCRWTTKDIQSRNTRRNRYFDINGEKKCLLDLCRDYNISYSLVHGRLTDGWAIERALTTPVQNKYSHSRNAGDKSTWAVLAKADGR